MAAGTTHVAATAAEPSAAPGEIVVSLEHVSLYYGRKPALQDVSLTVRAGERICVLGANGSGKSTLASVICGLLAPDEGLVQLVGEQVLGEQGVDFAAYRRARRDVGLVFQNPDDQIVTSIVEEDVAFGPENLGLPSDEIELRVRDELARVGMQEYARSDPSRLSGGQQQRVAIAGALAMRPRVLVLDEPGALLDVRGRRGIMRVMAELASEGTTIVHITHFMEEALAADRVIVLSQGRVMLDGTPKEVFSHEEELISLGLDMPFAARLSNGLRARGVDVPWTCDPDELKASLSKLLSDGTRTRRLDDGVGHDEPRLSERAGSATPVVTCEHVSYTYHDTDGRKALDDVSFLVGKNSSVAIVGQTGSGKSTLVRLICALERPDQGRIVVRDIDTSDRKGRQQLHGTIGYVMQRPERQLFANTVREDVSYGPKNMGLSAEEVDRRCSHALELVGLVDRDEDSPFQLSGGRKRLCAIAGILAMEPDVLVLDEPTAGLDPHARSQLEHILDDIHDHGVTLIRVTHSMDDAARSDQVIVLSQSRMLMQGSPSDVFCAAHGGELRRAGLGLPEALAWALDLGLEEEPLSMDELVDLLATAAGEVN